MYLIQTMNAQDYLIQNGVKPSVQRIALMDYLLTHKTHPNVEEMFCALNPTMPTLSRTTVYNTMKLFVKHGLALMVNIDEKNVRFDLKSHFHGHFLCTKCNNLYDFDVNENDVKTLSETLKDYEITDFQINCKGICKNCK